MRFYLKKKKNNSTYFPNDRNKNHIDELKQENEAKLNALLQKKEEYDAILKSHRRELDVSHIKNKFYC